MVVLLVANDARTRFAEDTPPVALPRDDVAEPDLEIRPRHVAVDAAAHLLHREPGSFRVRVEGEPADGLMLVLFDGESNARLGAQEVGPTLPQEITFAGVPRGRHYVRLARDPARARTSYITSAPVTVGGESGPPPIVRTTAGTLRVRIAHGAPPAEDAPPVSLQGIPILLRRQDDPNWRHRADRVSATDATGTVSFRDLGPGEYVLEPVGFEVDPKDQPRLRFRLGGFDESRPIRGRVR